MHSTIIFTRSHIASRSIFSFSSRHNAHHICTRLRRWQSTASKEKPYYITSPIFYVNAAPHVGHLYTMVLTDILKRWQVLKGRKAILCTGTDEHGMKIQQAAKAAEVDTKVFCDQNAEIFKQLAERLNISHDHFVRTTDPDHRFAVQHFWMLLQERGWIYESKHEGWYSISDETFYPESSVSRAMNPSTGKTFMASIETGKEVEWTSEINYHFKLSALREQLLEFYENNPKFIVPDSRMQEIVNSVRDGLSDLSISRPVSRLSWGIPVPSDETQTIYVWLDALINYLTKAGYPFQIPGAVGAWPADVQVIGKDITRFHCIYWPAFLMALDISPPKQILTHAHWTLGKQKMAKSTGNVVNPFFAVDRFGVDAIRFYMAHDGGLQNDSDYDNSFITDRYKKCLHSGLGNLVTRIVKSRLWSIKAAVETVTSGTDIVDEGSFIESLQELPQRVSTHFDNLDSGAAAKEIMKVIFATNAYISEAAPWSPKNADSMHRTIFLCAESCRISGILLQPFMPGKMNDLLDILGVAKERRTFNDAVFGADRDYGTPIVALKHRVEDSLFPPLPIEFPSLTNPLVGKRPIHVKKKQESLKKLRAQMETGDVKEG